MIKWLIWTIWTPMSSVLKKADKLNLSLSLSLSQHNKLLLKPIKFKICIPVMVDSWDVNMESGGGGGGGGGYGIKIKFHRVPCSQPKQQHYQTLVSSNCSVVGWWLGKHSVGNKSLNALRYKNTHITMNAICAELFEEAWICRNYIFCHTSKFSYANIELGLYWLR